MTCSTAMALSTPWNGYFSSEMHDTNWVEKTDLIVHKEESVRVMCVAWREARNGIDAVRERLAEKEAIS